jgi:hypothetical protein
MKNAARAGGTQIKATADQAPGRKRGCQLAAGIKPQTQYINNPLQGLYE